MPVRILIVDDQEISRLGLSLALRKSADIDIVGEATDGRTALLKCQEFHPDVVLMDLSMPRMNGIDAAKAIKTFNSSIKILMVTSNDKVEEMHKCLAAGVEGYCLKDASNSELLHAIKAVSSGHYWISPGVAPS